ncbi:MAG: hypothetical protein U1E37_04105 [Sphingomonadaceae bacterium]
MADNQLLRKLARSNGGKLLDAAIDTLLPVDASKLPARKKSLLGGLAGAVAVRVATRSVPGAIVVGGALIAKRLYDRRHARDRATASEKPRRAT